MWKPRVITVCIVYLLFACSASSQASVTISDISVTESGIEQDGEFCSDFRLTNAQAKSFFKRATKITPVELHNKFDYLPCYVRGRGRLDGADAEWEIRAGGTGRLVTTSGQVSWYGCTKCDDLFRGK